MTVSRSSICRRALKLLGDGALLAATGEYVRTDTLIHPGQDKRLELTPCTVCALGALFVAAIDSPRREYDWGIISDRYVAYHLVTKVLLEAGFKQSELDEIENDFEAGQSHPNPDQCLRLILERYIR